MPCQVGNAAYHNDMLYEELRRSIPQLTTLLLGPEEDKTKGNAAGALSNLVRNSDMLCEDIVSQGAIQVGLVFFSYSAAVCIERFLTPHRGSIEPLKNSCLVFYEDRMDNFNAN